MMSYSSLVGTTVWVDDETRAQLRRIQNAFGDPSVNATIKRLIEQPATDAASIFAKHRTEIKAILARHKLRDLVAFGSRARGDASPTSDLDLAVRPAPGASPLAILSAEEELEKVLGLAVNIVEIPNARLDTTIAREGVRFRA